MPKDQPDNLLAAGRPRFKAVRQHKKPGPEDALLAQLEKEGIKASDKLRQALALGTADASTRRYKDFYDDSALIGLLRAQTPLLHLLETQGLDVSSLLERLPVTIDKTAAPGTRAGKPRVTEYRQTYAPRDDRYRNRSARWRVPARYTTIGPPQTPIRAQDLVGPSGEADSTQLMLRLLDMPVVWHHTHSLGLSTNKILRHLRNVRRIEPDIEQQKFCISLGQRGLEVSAFDFIDRTPVAQWSEHPTTGLLLLRHQILTPRECLLSEELEEFEWMINRPDVSEHQFQRFFEARPDFLLGLEHRSLRSQVVLTREDRPDLRPDFMLERLDGGFADLLELKTPQERLAVGRNGRRTVSATLHSALAQLRTYRSYFDDVAHRSAFYTKYGLHAYKPRLFLIIGRSSGFSSPEERADIEDELRDAKLLTFDDILLRARRRLQLLSSS